MSDKKQIDFASFAADISNEEGGKLQSHHGNSLEQLRITSEHVVRNPQKLCILIENGINNVPKAEVPSIIREVLAILRTEEL